MARVIAVCNQKGGVGKTTTAVNLGAYLAAAGKKTLLVDFDPQGNASSALGHSPLHTTTSVYHGVLGHAEPKAIIRPSQLYNFHLIPAAPHLAGLLIELVNEKDREHFLRRFLHYVRHDYDYVLIDLPPSLSLLTVNGLVAGDEVLIPVQAEYYSLEGIGQLLETVDLVKRNLHHPLTIAGALLTMYDKREHLSREVGKNIRRHFPYQVFDTEIPRSVALAEAPSFSKPVLLHRPDSNGALAYRRLADEIIAQERTRGAREIVGAKNFGNFNVAI
ncbi:ParA family protein [Candidatus Parcubacteria bacterium]|nr:MAG: ParA family protein [Candidatus Parcubacteria bacterium]